MKLKLFIWEGTGVLQDYTSGMVCVLAEDIGNAIELIKKKDKHALNEIPINDFKVIEKPEAFTCRGGG